MLVRGEVLMVSLGHWFAPAPRAFASVAIAAALVACGSPAAAPTSAPAQPAAATKPAASPALAPAPSPAAGAAASPAARPAAASGTPVEVQVILGQSGSAAFLGKSETEAVQAVEKVVNEQQGGIQGRPIHFVISDDQSNPTVDVQIANRLISQKVTVILGPSVVASCSAIAPLIANGPVMYCFSPGIHPDPGSYAFSSGVSTADMAAKTVDYFRSQGYTRIAAITSTDATGQDAENSIKTSLQKSENAGLQLVANEHFNTSDVSVDAQLSRIKAAQPQAMFAWSTGNAIATVFKAIQQSGLTIPVATTDGNMSYAQMQQYADFLPRPLLIPTGQWPAYTSLPAGPVKDTQKAFYDALQAAGIKPEIGHTLGWDPTIVVVDALRHVGPDASAQQIRDYINSLTSFPGVDGPHDYKTSPQRGLTVKEVVVTRWDPAQSLWVPVYQ